MYNSAFYKLAARTRLKNNYLAAFIGTLIYIIPTYLGTLLSTLLLSSASGAIIAIITELLFVIFVINIFNVGYLRFLLTIEPKEENDSETKYDYNRILSGFTNNFAGTLKTTFVRDIKLLGWALLPFVALLIFAGVSVAVVYCSGQGRTLYSYVMQLIVSPTPDMATHLLEFLISNYNILMILSLVASVGMLVLMIPYLYKTYEYAVTDMIVADHPDMTTSDVFIRSKNIMHGFRTRFFMLQMSFLLYQLLIALILEVTGSVIIYYIAMSAFLPYMQVTLLEFYRERNNTIEHNISVYGEQ